MRELFKCSYCSGLYSASPKDQKILCPLCARAKLHKVTDITESMHNKIFGVLNKKFDAESDQAYLLATVYDQTVVLFGFFPGCRHRLDAHISEANPEEFEKVKKDLVRGIVLMLLTGVCGGKDCGKDLSAYHRIVFETNDQELISYVRDIVMPEVKRLKSADAVFDKDKALDIFNKDVPGTEVTWN